MNAHLVLRLLDTFFRRRWRYLLVIAIVGAAGVAAAASNGETYQSVGTMRVEPDARVAQLTGSQTDPGFGWETPAGATARSMNSLLGTKTFVETVITKGGLEQAIEAGLITPSEVRSSIGVYADGANLVKVVGQHESPEVAQRVSAAAMEGYVEAVMANEISDNAVAREFLDEKLPDYEAELAAAEAELESWIEANPEPSNGADRPTDEQLQLERLQRAVLTQDQRLAETRASIEQAELSVEQKEAEVRQRFAVIDPPEVPFAPLSTLRAAALTVAMALVLGGVVAFTAVVLATMLDRTIRFPGDVKDRLDMRVLAVVPQVRAKSLAPRRLTERPAAPPTAHEPGPVDKKRSAPVGLVDDETTELTDETTELTDETTELTDETTELTDDDTTELTDDDTTELTDDDTTELTDDDTTELIDDDTTELIDDETGSSTAAPSGEPTPSATRSSVGPSTDGRPNGTARRARAFGGRIRSGSTSGRGH